MNAGPHRHAEAFKLMHYRSEESGHELVVWNSRDGVTPYIFRHPDTRETYRHVEWHRDVYAPDHRPKVGEFFFEDLTRERALARRRREVVACWGRAEHGWPAMRDDPRYAGLTWEQAAERLAEADLQEPGWPMLSRWGVAEEDQP